MGSALFANVVAHFGINYMTHLIMCLFFLLVCISAATYEVSKGPDKRKFELERPRPT